MSALYQPLKPAGGSAGSRWVIFLLCLGAVCKMPARQNAANPLSVDIRVWTPMVVPAGTPHPPGGWPPPGGWSDDRKTFVAPCDLHISAAVGGDPPAHKGGSVTVDFFSGTNKLGSGKSVWMPELDPSAHAHRNEAFPTFIRPAQYSMAEWVWSNTPPGRYSLTARVTLAKNPPAISSPVDVTILPPPASDTSGHK